MQGFNMGSRKSGNLVVNGKLEKNPNSSDRETTINIIPRLERRATSEAGMVIIITIGRIYRT